MLGVDEPRRRSLELDQYAEIKDEEFLGIVRQ